VAQANGKHPASSPQAGQALREMRQFPAPALSRALCLPVAFFQSKALPFIYIVSQGEMAMSELLIRKSIQVEASVETLWKVLTENEFIQQYMFGCYADTDWKPGSPLLWKGVADEKLYVKGHVVAIDPPNRLEYTIIDPNSTIPDIPANYLTMQYILTKRGDSASTLEIVQGDFAKVADGQSRYQHSLDPDDSILVAIKKLAESQPLSK
jgi:uncharacterized protein YndB with AHSA1/START domain